MEGLPTIAEALLDQRNSDQANLIPTDLRFVPFLILRAKKAHHRVPKLLVLHGVNVRQRRPQLLSGEFAPEIQLTELRLGAEDVKVKNISGLRYRSPDQSPDLLSGCGIGSIVRKDQGRHAVSL